MTGMLASVANPTEALLCLNARADIIDGKDPGAGALGALPEPVIREIIDTVQGRRPVSATIGDLPTRADSLIPAVRRIGATGVDYVKLGLLNNAGIPQAISALADLSADYRLIAVLFADRLPPLDCIPDLAAAGFAGVMLDTAEKHGDTLIDIMKPADLSQFVNQSKRHGLLCGLAGSLRLEQITQLLSLSPDYLGFRGALCEQGRTSRISPNACAQVREAIPIGMSRSWHSDADQSMSVSA